MSILNGLFRSKVPDAHSTAYKAMELLSSGRLEEAYQLARNAVQQNSNESYAHYALGECFRFAQDYPKACAALSRANELEPRQPSVLLALAIARQLNAEYPAALDAIRLAVEIDPDFAIAYNTGAMTQKLMGAYEKSASNYEAGLKALARTIVKSMHNAEDSPRLPHWDSRNSLWTEYALFGAIWLIADSSVEQLAWPTGEMAERDAKTQEFRGWYWKQFLDAEQKMTRLMYPNYFNTFCSRLRADSLYAILVGNRSTVLRLMGSTEEADKHLQEAEDFTK
jgi:tetratricopeptide (TPR) repeat protein